MASWFQKSAPPPDKEPQDFSLRIDAHPDTHLLQSLQINETDSIQILQLGKHYYAQKKTKYQRSQPLLIQDTALCEKIRKQQILPLHLEPLFDTPPAHAQLDILLDDHSPALSLSAQGSSQPKGSAQLTLRLKEAMADFIENNPETASALNLGKVPKERTAAPKQSALSAYAEHGSLGGKTPELPALNELTRPVVLAALQQASENQQAHLEKAQKLKTRLTEQSQKLETLLEELPNLEARLNKLSERLVQIHHHFKLEKLEPESLLQKTAQELAQLQTRMEEMLTEALSLQNLLELYPQNHNPHLKTGVDQLKRLIHEIVEQRHQVNYFLQQHAFQELEQLRLEHLLKRQSELENAIQELKTSIEQLERINQEILNQDPLAVPEPIPALALHELSRLETELGYLRQDPVWRLKPREKSAAQQEPLK
ncbi:hypothetical protein COW36_10610 [bacterium (Candidatus Blackallbacteria) CG17_big_fil_post_rev_8_21_14_2_50_48_46]|uniref:Uncharacterized protein n=1 Tax=bacterium (Candidatus Blackallbacteria) CG17_big_fil_post_rev_8_21_14_2_50_48_46 TaxID=2014261 RepID=A0A2M7G576_9BACT|nr:MAG: hypothetical protein COW64_20385 [bacterium (Candidatus Blackallbacteria) CG18_big_fil_WC_8_21_14_2_50_49_26]PIW17080.1 MAG: hypothetical protein COW36_10610 [bacterium (Candidatus Blackallbacteria) CG17_big_fil_post_rev_8_21_14_2_50_48_46]PIW47685.1 MAG: hypothetical protein COW20_11610 [bacterium (Candidatus Blackallbacteria) CG13_big_fil_rev_8_21_14_2_50_49_14]